MEHALGQLIQDRVIRADMNGNIAPFSDLLIKDPNDECSLLIAFVVNDQHDLAGEFNRSSNADHILKKISTVLPDSTPLVGFFILSLLYRRSLSDHPEFIQGCVKWMNYNIYQHFLVDPKVALDSK